MKSKIKEIKYRGRLFNSLLDNSDTIYLLYELNKEEPIYMTKNVFEVLNLDVENDNQCSKEIIKKIFETPIIKEEYRKWDGKCEFVSRMFSYRNSNTLNKVKWLKVKIYPFEGKRKKYQIRLIFDATKEYESQHLLVMQSQDIKANEKKLNQIMSTSYDFSLNLNIAINEGVVKNFKENDFNFFSNLKFRYEENIEKILKENIHIEDMEIVQNFFSYENLKKQFSNEQTTPLSITYRLANKKPVIWLESTAFFTIIRGDQHVTILTKNVTKDAEYMRNQNALLQTALEEAKNANIAKTDFLRMVSHEIRTSMNAIIGLSESVLMDDLSLVTREDVTSINSASKNLLEIFDEILDVSKIESGIIEKNEKEYETSKLFLDIINITRERVQPKKLNLEIKIEESIPSVLYGDVSKIRQVLLNIIDNAIKYTDKGNIIITGSSEKQNYNTKLIISIKDTGTGIEGRKLNKLFEGSNGKLMKNTGLAISKRIIDLLNGQIIVESVVGEGSTFKIVVTQKTINSKPIGDIEHYRFPQKKVIAFNAKGKKVLVVDDNKIDIKVATRLLKPYNIDIESVTSGKECFDLIKTGKKYDLILLDQMMPEMTGTETLSKLKGLKGFKIPVVVVTADAIVGVKEKYLNDGFDDYMSKPIDVNELNHLLKKYLS